MAKSSDQTSPPAYGGVYNTGSPGERRGASRALVAPEAMADYVERDKKFLPTRKGNRPSAMDLPNARFTECLDVRTPGVAFYLDDVGEAE